MTFELLFKLFVVSALVILFFAPYWRKQSSPSTSEDSSRAPLPPIKPRKEHVLVPPTKLSIEEIESLIDEELKELDAELDVLEPLTEEEIQGIEKEYTDIFGSDEEEEVVEDEASVTSDDMQQIKQTLHKISVQHELPTESELRDFDEAVDKFSGYTLAVSLPSSSHRVYSRP